jgi:hypothetical protein
MGGVSDGRRGIGMSYVWAYRTEHAPSAISRREERVEADCLIEVGTSTGVLSLLNSELAPP